MKPEISHLPWNVRQRLEFIEFRLFWEGRVNRKDVMDMFSISTPQATADFKLYKSLTCDAMRYDSQARCYVASEEFHPVLADQTGQGFLAQLRLLALEVAATERSWIGQLPCFESIPPLSRRVDAATLRKVLRALRDGTALHVHYQSLSRDAPIWRWISPRALAHDGLRWHVRAWCHLRKGFQDFVFARMLEAGEIEELGGVPENDIEWSTNVEFELMPHPELSSAARQAIALDYEMPNGSRRVPVRMALSYYFERALNLDVPDGVLPPERQQIVCRNRLEVDAARAALRDKERNHVESATNGIEDK